LPADATLRVAEKSMLAIARVVAPKNGHSKAARFGPAWIAIVPAKAPSVCVGTSRTPEQRHVSSSR